MIGIKTTLTIVVVIVTISLFSFANMALAARRTAKDAAQQAGDEGAKKPGVLKEVFANHQKTNLNNTLHIKNQKLSPYGNRVYLIYLFYRRR